MPNLGEGSLWDYQIIDYICWLTVGIEVADLSYIFLNKNTCVKFISPTQGPMSPYQIPN